MPTTDKKFQDWERNWDTLHDATDRFLKRHAYESMHSFHHRLLLAMMAEVPSKKFLAELDRIENDLIEHPVEVPEEIAEASHA